jgi:hypothetical protein
MKTAVAATLIASAAAYVFVVIAARFSHFLSFSNPTHPMTIGTGQHPG